MSTSSVNASIEAILAKPNKTVNDLQQIVDQWHNGLLKNEGQLLQYAEQLNQKQLDLNEDVFSVILIGKDGGVKLRSAEPVSAEAIFGLIDGMPMRQREMRNR